MALPLMPKATAVWLIENTALTFDQIAAFCGLHILEVRTIADGEAGAGMIGFSPIQSGQLAADEISRCEQDSSARLKLAEIEAPSPRRKKGPRYVPVTKRGDKPDAIAWLLKSHPELSDSQICDLIGTTKETIKRVRDRTHWNANNIKARHPVLLGLTTQKELDSALQEATGSASAPANAPSGANSTES